MSSLVDQPSDEEQKVKTKRNLEKSVKFASSDDESSANEHNKHQSDHSDTNNKHSPKQFQASRTYKGVVVKSDDESQDDKPDPKKR